MPSHHRQGACHAQIGAETLERITREIFAALGRARGRRGVGGPPARPAPTCAATTRTASSASPSTSSGLKSGTINPTPHIATVVDTPTLAVLDGDGGFGQVVARRGIELAIEQGARARGSSAVALRGTTHVGRLADYAETAASAGPRRHAVGQRASAGSTWRRGAARRAGSAPTRTPSPSRARTAPWRCRTTSPPACGPRASCA